MNKNKTGNVDNQIKYSGKKFVAFPKKKLSIAKDNQAGGCLKKATKILWFIFQYAVMDIFPIKIFGISNQRKTGKKVSNVWKSVTSSIIACLPAVINILIIFLMVTAGIVIGGIVKGAANVIKVNITDNPLVNCLTVSALSSAKIQKINKDIISNIQSLKTVSGVYGWEYASLLFYKNDGSINVDYSLGRTVQIKEPVLKKIEFISNSEPKLSKDNNIGVITSESTLIALGYLKTFEKLDDIPEKIKEKGFPKGAGIYYDSSQKLLICEGIMPEKEKESLLEFVGISPKKKDHSYFACNLFHDSDNLDGKGINTIKSYKEAINQLYQKSLNNIPQRLQIRYKNRAESIPVLGIAKWVPNGEFLIEENFWNKFRDGRVLLNPFYKCAYLGPVPFERKKQVLVAISDYLNNIEISPKFVDRESKKWFKLCLPENKKWRKNYWEKTFLSTIQSYIKKSVFAETLYLEFGPSQEDTPKDAFLKLQKDWYLNAAVYVKKLKLINSTANTLQKMGLTIDKEVVENLGRLKEFEEFGSWTLAVILLVIGTICSMNIFLTFFQTIQSKISEIGIFMAMGASRPIVAAIYIVEGIIIWTLAFVSGWIFSDIVGNTVASFLKTTFQLKESLSLFQPSLHLILRIAIITISICILSTLLASLRATRKQPGQAIRS